MLLSKLIGERYKEWPSEATLASHGLLVRGGYIRQVANGLYTLLPPAKKMVAKIESIIREEMDRIGGQEVLMPVVLPRELWERSGRYESVGRELLRFADRTGHDMLLAMTHEEAVVSLASGETSSYTDYPFMLYQLQTKFRDEPRSRGGLIRTREFTMKDAYSFHTNEEDLLAYYDVCLKAYERIFARAGLPQTVCVESDSGMMGGSIAHEFMLLCDAGEDTIATCECGYMSNVEAAEALYEPVQVEKLLPEEEVHTPGVTDLDALATFFGMPLSRYLKSVVFTNENDGRPVIVFLRGDMEVNEAKLSRAVMAPVSPRVGEPGDGLCYGYIGPVGLAAENCTVLFDRSLEGAVNMICGANRQDYHRTGVNVGDLDVSAFYDVAQVKSGMPCPACKSGRLLLQNGIELGNIFQLGDKYTKSMGMFYTDADGSRRTPIMGCYGIGVGRLLASVCEVSHDDNGPIWPASIAPWQVHICAIRYGEPEVRAAADALYNALWEQGIEAILDDRDVSAGIQFADADLLGVPLRAVVSPRNLKNGCLELKARDGSFADSVSQEDGVGAVLAKLRG